MCVFRRNASGRNLVVTHQVDDDGLCHPVALDEDLKRVPLELRLSIHTDIEKLRWVPRFLELPLGPPVTPR